MNNRIRLVLLAVIVLTSVSIWSCGKEDVDLVQPTIFGDAVLLRPLNLQTLADESNICYELWLVDIESTTDSDSNSMYLVQKELSLGKFFWRRTPYAFYTLNNVRRDSVFATPNGENVYDYNTIMITLEPLADDGVRSNNGLIFDVVEFGQPIEGQFNLFDEPALTVVHEVDEPLLVADYVIRSYSDDGDPREAPLQGIWFHDFTLGQGGNQQLAKTLSIPVIRENAHVTYEGWVYKPDFSRPLSTGKFKNPRWSDWSHDHIGENWYPNIPGEDFIKNPPADFTPKFGPSEPMELVGEGGEAYITLEPYPDPDPNEPFPMILFKANLPKSETSARGGHFPMESLYDVLPSFNAVVLTQ